MSAIDTFIFNSSENIIEGWYWALRSSELKKKKTRAVSLLGRNLALYRTESGQVRAMDAYCPHMGAHLAEGKVEGENIRCFFHFWKFDENGNCIEIPCQKATKGVPRIKTWPVQERYGLIWIWTGDTPRWDIPWVPELEGKKTYSMLGDAFSKPCHPNVMMINAIDAQHFASVHNLPVHLDMHPETVNENNITFKNTTNVPTGNFLTRFISRFYSGSLTYNLSYWYGSTGSVTLGPDFIHFHIMFTLRPTEDGKSQGQTILITKHRNGLFGRMLNWALLKATNLVGKYFATGDTFIFKTINFKMKFPIKSDGAIVNFVKHAEKQTVCKWGTWEVVSNPLTFKVEKNHETIIEV